MREIEKILKKKGVKRVKLNVKSRNLRALSFYLKNGYSIDGVTILMAWDNNKELNELNDNMKSIEIISENLKGINGIHLTWWSDITEKVDREVYKYYKCEIAHIIYLNDKFCGAIEFKPENSLYIDYLIISHSNPQKSLITVMKWLKKYAIENNIHKVIIPVDSSKRVFIKTMIEEGFKIHDIEYRLSKDLD